MVFVITGDSPSDIRDLFDGYLSLDSKSQLVNYLDGIDPSRLSVFGKASFVGLSARNTAVFGTVYSATLGGFPCGVVGYGELNTAGGYVCGTYGHVITTASGVATNELCVENRAGAPSASLPPNRALGSTDNLSIIQTIATLGNAGNFDVSIGTHYSRNGCSMLTGIYMGADSCVSNGVFIDATSTIGATRPLWVRGAGGKSTVADFQYMNTPDDLVYNTRWLDSAGGVKAAVTAGGSLQALGQASAISRLRVGSVTGSPAKAQLDIVGAGQATAYIADSGNTGGMALVHDAGVNAGNGGAVLFGGGPAESTFFAGVKGLGTNFTGNTTGDLAFSVRLNTTDASLAKAWSIQGYDRALLPAVDGGINVGSASFRVNTYYATTGSINTSDARLKTNVRGLTDAEKRAAKRILGTEKIYQWIASIEEKGEDASRWHVGYIAQDVIAALEAERLDPWRYSFICQDDVIATVTKTRTVSIQAVEDVEEQFEEIVVEGDTATLRKSKRIVQRPKVKTIPLLGVDGIPIEGRTYAAPVMVDVEQEYDVTEQSGEKRLGLRYSGLLVFLMAALA